MARMAVAAEIELSEPMRTVLNKCYNYIEVTRKDGGRYYSTNRPEYVGKYIGEEREGPHGDGATYFALFELNGNVRRIPYSYWNNTHFYEVACRRPAGAGAGNIRSHFKPGYYRGGTRSKRGKKNNRKTRSRN